MDLDHVFIAILVGGIGLSIAYLVAEYLRWRAQGAVDRRRDILQRELHAARLIPRDAAPPQPRLAVCDKSLPERRTAKLASQRQYPYVERRKLASSSESGGSIDRSA